MPTNKSAVLRYRVIDDCLTNRLRKYPSKEYIIDQITDKTGKEISTSMFDKDIKSMKEMYSAPIAFDRNNKGYYYTQDDFSIKEFPLTNEEIEALDFSTALLGLLKGTGMLSHYETAINKVIEGYRLSKVIGKPESEILQVEEPLQSKDARWLEVILKSILEKNVLNITYQPFAREAKVHEVSPYLLKEYRNRWYLVGHSSRAENIIVLALDRMNNIEQSKSKYISSETFNSSDFFKYSIGITQVHSMQPEEVILSFTPLQAQFVLSQPLHHSQEVILESGEEVRIRFKVYLTQELIMLILSYGAEVKVIAPEALKVKIRESISKMSSLYSG
jgi:predicted DNA-binding transcriptional regulator YafY